MKMKIDSYPEILSFCVLFRYLNHQSHNAMAELVRGTNAHWHSNRFSIVFCMIGSILHAIYKVSEKTYEQEILIMPNTLNSVNAIACKIQRSACVINFLLFKSSGTRVKFEKKDQGERHCIDRFYKRLPTA